MKIELYPEQEAAAQKAFEWFKAWEKGEHEQQVFQFTGYAGTGKTTTLKALIKRLGAKPVYAAYTGKAALVMRKVAGLPAQTIHSLIYNFVGASKAKCEELYQEIAAGEAVYTKEELKELKIALKRAQEPRFELHQAKTFDTIDLFVLDECSMVNGELLADLKSFGKPILALGDPGQLPPIDGAGALFVGEPDVKLTEIHRQAEGSPILDAVTNARKGYPWAVQPYTKEIMTRPFSCTGRHSANEAQFRDVCLGVEQIITGTHKTRRAINIKMREWLGYDITDPYPQVGERLCCWKNERKLNLLNGLMCEVVERGELHLDYVDLWIKTDLMEEGDEPLQVRALSAHFDAYYDPEAPSRVKSWQRRDTQEFDFGYVITVHKAQGSQWDSVLFVDDGLWRGWRAKAKERRKLIYTAGTRAANQLFCFVS